MIIIHDILYMIIRFKVPVYSKKNIVDKSFGKPSKTSQKVYKGIYSLYWNTLHHDRDLFLNI